jgi:hypothetical protein
MSEVFHAGMPGKRPGRKRRVIWSSNVPSRDQELAMMAWLDRAMEEATEQDWRELADFLPPSLKVAVAGAQLDATVQLVSHSQLLGLVNRGQGGTREGVKLLTIAIARCLNCHHCPHVSDPAIVKFAFLAPRVLTCRACVGDFLGIIADHDSRRLGADECDVCLAQGVEMFCQIGLSYQGCVCYGDVCPDCYPLLAGSPSP